MKKLTIRVVLCCAALTLIACFGLVSCNSSDNAASEEAPEADVYVSGTTNLHLDGVYWYADEDDVMFVRFFNGGLVRGIECDAGTTPEEGFELLETSGGEWTNIMTADTFTTKASLEEGDTSSDGALEIDTIEFVLENADRGITIAYNGEVHDDTIDFMVDKVFENSVVPSDLPDIPYQDEPETYTYTFTHVDLETTETE